MDRSPGDDRRDAVSISSLPFDLTKGFVFCSFRSFIRLFIHVLFIAVQSLTGQCLIENCSAWSLRAGAAGICRCYHHINVPKETVRNMVRANSCLVSMLLICRRQWATYIQDLSHDVLGANSQHSKTVLTTCSGSV